MNKIAVFQREHNSIKRNGFRLQPEGLFKYVRDEQDIYGYKFIGYIVEVDYYLNRKVDEAFELFKTRHPELFKEKP